MALESDFAEYLEDNSIGTVYHSATDSDGDIFINHQPENRANCISVYGTGGYNVDPHVWITDATIQVLVRNRSNATAMSTAMSIYTLVKRQVNIELVGGGTFVLFMNPVALPARIGKDANDRSEVSLNINLKIRETS